MLGNWRRIILAAPLCLMGMGCAGVEYVDNSTLKEMGFYEQGEKGTVPKQYGALMLGKKDESAKGDPSMLLLRKYKSQYTAETLLFDSKGDPKSTFEKTYFSVGADQKDRSLRFSLRFTF